MNMAECIFIPQNDTFIPKSPIVGVDVVKCLQGISRKSNKRKERTNMKPEKRVISSLLTSVLAFVGTLAITTPTCLGWFYELKKPEGLK